MQIKDFAKIFFVILILHLAVLDVGESEMLIRFTKPLLLFSLIAFYMHHTSQRQNFESTFLAGLFFSLAGDVFLMLEQKGEIYFMLGLGAFLVAQIFYTISFLIENKHAKGLVQRQLWLLLPFLAYGFWFVQHLQNNLGELLAPVAVYASMLVAMAASALNRNGKVATKSFWLVFAGALFFVASDSFLAIAKFVGPFPKSGIVVMATYGIAQFLLVWGMLYQRLHPNTDQHQKRS